jgi:tetratricopeptide (TPR) repeat protein
MIKANGTLSKDDFIQCQFYSLRRRLPFIFTIIIICVLFELYVIFYPVRYGSQADYGYLLSNWPLMLFLLSAPLIIYLTVYLKSKHAFNKDKSIRKNQTYEFSEQGFRFTDDSSVVERSWADLSNFRESKRQFILYLVEHKAYLIPKRWLNQEETETLRLLLNKNLERDKGGFFKKKTLLQIGLAVLLMGTVIYFSLSDSDAGKASLDKGIDKEKKKDYQGALADFNRAIQENPNLAEAYLRRGYIKSVQDNYTGELEDCSKAIALNPNYGDAYIGLGYAKYKLGDTLGACEDFHKAEQMGMESAKAFIQSYCK